MDIQKELIHLTTEYNFFFFKYPFDYFIEICFPLYFGK